VRAVTPTGPAPGREETGSAESARGRGLVRAVAWAARAAAALAALVATGRYGPAVTVDSTNYLAAAESLRAGEGLRTVFGTPYTFWPPLFPLVLSVPARAGSLEPIAVARLVNATAFGLTVALAGELFASTLRSPALAALATASLALSPTLLEAAVTALSEPLYVLLLLALALSGARYGRDPAPSRLVVPTILAALCGLQRYAGVSAIAAGAILIASGPAGLPLRVRAGRAGRFAFYALLPLALWGIRNAWLTAQPVGDRGGAVATPISHLHVIADSVSAWVLPPEVPPGIRSALVLPAVVILGWLGSGARGAGAQYVMLVHVPVYLLFVLALAFTTAIPSVNDRLLVPVALALHLSAWTGADVLLHRWRVRAAGARRRTVLLPAVLGVAMLVQIAPARRAAINMASWIGDGAGSFSTTLWQESGIARWLARERLAGRVLSNCPWAVWLYSRTRCEFLPVGPAATARLKLLVAAGTPVHLVWFDIWHQAPVNFDPRPVTEGLHAAPVATLPEGTVVRLLPAR
jgi:hypothetical protein